MLVNMPEVWQEILTTYIYYTSFLFDYTKIRQILYQSCDYILAISLA